MTISFDNIEPADLTDPACQTLLPDLQPGQAAEGFDLDLVRAKRKAEAENLAWPPKNFSAGQPWGWAYLPVEYLDVPVEHVPTEWHGVSRPTITAIPGFTSI